MRRIISWVIVAMAWLPTYGQINEPLRVLSERMAGFHETMIRFDERVPNTAVMTYHDTVTQIYMTGMLSASIDVGGELIKADKAQEIVVEDFPGGVEATYKLGDVNITARHTTLLIGRGTPEKDGATVYSIKTDPAVPIIIRCRGGKYFPSSPALMAGFMHSGSKWLNIANEIDIQKGHAIFTDPALPFYTAVSSLNGTLKKGQSQEDPYVDLHFPNGQAQIIVAFAPDKERAISLSKLNPSKELKAVADYYDNLLASRIETPEPVLNEAFRSAIYNLEYNYLKPFGWIECINHWLAVWHQQHTRAAEWLGQEERSRLCIKAQAELIFANNQIPNIHPNGDGFESFGGTNQYWSWELRHYLKFTNDRDFLKEMIPYMDRVLQGTIDRDDPDANGLFAWGLQIGNQEDFFATPHDGTAPTIEAINMMTTRAEMAEAMGDIPTANYWRNQAHKSRINLKQNLWLKGLGRFGFFYDATGMMRTDSAYHAFLYPAIWDIVDPLDQYTGIRHAVDRLMGSDGEIYCSNNFSEHYTGTWGMQAGCAQQPWGAWGLAKIGMRNQAYRPLKAAAQWAMDINHRGSWPEISTEPNPAYFTPPAGLYISSMIEAIYGLKPNALANTLEISPAFPDHWPQASLHLPKYNAKYKRDGNTISYEISTEQSFKRQLRWKLPPCKIKSFKVDSKKVDYKITPGVDCIELQADLPAAKDTSIEIKYKPLEYTLISPKSIAQGDSFKLKLNGAKIHKIIDRSSVLSQSSHNGSTAEAVIQNDLIDSYLPFGRLGLLNFSRRTFFLECVAGDGIIFFLPVDIAVLPRFEVSGEIKGTKVELLIRNNTFSDHDDKALLNLGDEFLSFDLNLSARSEKKVSIPLRDSFISNLSLGDNSVSIIFNQHDKAPFILCMTSKLPDKAASLEQLTLNTDAIIPDTDWPFLRTMQGQPHIFFVWPQWREPLKSLEGKNELKIPEIPSLTFKINERKFIPISRKTNQSIYSHKQ